MSDNTKKQNFLQGTALLAMSTAGRLLICQFGIECRTAACKQSQDHQQDQR